MFIPKNSQSQKNSFDYEYKMLIPVIKPTFLRMIIPTFGTRVQSHLRRLCFEFRDHVKKRIIS